MLHHATSITDGNHHHSVDEHDEDHHGGHHGDEHYDGQRDANLHDDGRHDVESGAHGHPRTSHRTQERGTPHDELDKVLKQLTHAAHSNAGEHTRHFRV